MRARRLITALAASAVALGVGAGPAAALSTTADDTGMVNDKVFALAAAGTTIYVGGHFSETLDASGNLAFHQPALAALNATPGLPIGSFAPAFAKADGVPEVRALSVSPDG